MITHGATRGLMNAASPGVISLFLENVHYPTREAYLAALAEAMRDEYRTIIAAGLDLQLDCSDLALSRHMLLPTRRERVIFSTCAWQWRVIWVRSYLRAHPALSPSAMIKPRLSPPTKARPWCWLENKIFLARVTAIP